jgi:hypothetical protein
MASKKYDKRRALFCKLIGKSDSHQGYYKYLVTIGEKNGKITKHPVYGKDMQNAINRLIHKERTAKVEEKFGAGTVFILWLMMMGVPAFYMEQSGSPIYVLFGFLGIGLLIGTIAWWYNHITKGE